MTVTITDGWMSGSLPDDTGRTWPVVQARQVATGSQNGASVALVLHTTETDHLVPNLQYPSNFQCGDGKIVQHIRLGSSGDAVFTWDRDNIGIEMVGRSQLKLWLPAESTLGPTVALVRWLADTKRINGVVRPYDFPDVLDQLPAAVTTYYRRKDPRAKAGIYGHVDLTQNDHWDPGSFNYTAFLKRVTTGGEEMAYADYKDGVQAARKGDPLPANANNDFTFGYNLEKRIQAAAKTPVPTPSTTVAAHTHDVSWKGKTGGVSTP